MSDKTQIIIANSLLILVTIMSQTAVVFVFRAAFTIFLLAYSKQLFSKIGAL